MPFALRLLVVLAACLLAGAPALRCAAPAAAARPAQAAGFRVFVVQSYNQEYIWTQNINEGIREALRGLNVVYEYFYMDAKRRPSPAEQRKAAQDALERIEKSHPQVVVAVDDAAQVYLVEPSLKGRASPQVIFCGVNAPLSLYGYPAANVSGVRERWHFREGFAFLKRLLPATRSVAVLVDSSESGGYVLGDLHQERAEGGPFMLEVLGAEQVRTFQEWQRKVLSYQEKADALALGLYHSLVDERTGAVVPVEQVIAWHNQVIRKPTLGFSDAVREDGHLAGVLESGHEQGFLAGNMARSVLEKGWVAGDLPVATNQRGIVFLNLKAAERLGLSIPYEFIEAGEVVVQ